MTGNDTDKYGSEMDAYRHGYHDAIEDYDEELRELVEQWRNGTLPREGTFDQAADQLEELVEDE